MLLNYTGLGFGSVMLQGLIFFSGLTIFFACKWNSFVLLLVGRALFGMGGESLIVAQAAMAEKWFTGKFLSLAIGLNNVVSLVGSAVAAWLGPEIFVERRTLQWVVFVMTAIAFVIWIFNVGYWIVEEKLIKQENEQEDYLEDLVANRRRPAGDDESSGRTTDVMKKSFKSNAEVKFTFKHVGHLGKLFWMLTFVFAFVSMAYF